VRADWVDKHRRPPIALLKGLIEGAASGPTSPRETRWRLAQMLQLPGLLQHAGFVLEPALKGRSKLGAT